MTHSTVTNKGQTIIPGKIRKALRIRPGDTLEYVVEGDHATIQVHPGTRSLKGALASKSTPDASLGSSADVCGRTPSTDKWSANF
jgi:AbrB family looped-hinge helix DNA binding protein